MSEADPLPPTAEIVVDKLKLNRGSLTRQELITKTDRCESAVNEALNVLENRGRITRTRKSDNLRVTTLDLEGCPDA